MKIRLITTAVFAALLAGSATSPATAAPIIECDRADSNHPNFYETTTAPEAERDYTEFFFLSCNVSPTQAGVSNINITLGSIWMDKGQRMSGATHGGTSQHRYEEMGWAVEGKPTLKPYAEVYLVGTFTYGSVPGCGRVSDLVVRCYWEGPSKRLENRRGPSSAMLQEPVDLVIPGV